MDTREAIFSPGQHALYEEIRYSAAIRSGDLLFVARQVSSRDDGTPEPDHEDQVRQAFANRRAVLDATGGTLDDIVDAITL
jgi:enamine deaminase RidA (YjgF/YER057c/UK114 family)